MRRYPCAICGHPDIPANMIWSRFTRNRYCRDEDACNRRMLRKHRARKRALAAGLSEES